ncbi:MAG: tetratricopeptide repeat protein [Bauldia sp.]
MTGFRRALLAFGLTVAMGATVGEVAAAEPFGPASVRSEAEQDYLDGLRLFSAADYAGAISLWSRLGESADPRSGAGLAFLYTLGAGTPVDEPKAYYWARLAAERGQPEAQGILGRFYLEGRVVEKDLIQAFAWCETAQMGGGGNGCRGAALRELPDSMLSTAFRASNELQERLRRELWGR